jgi:UDP-glucose 4-epimerase
LIKECIWIAGAHGFIGKHLAKMLASSGHKVSGLGHGSWPALQAAESGVSQWINGDINSENLQLLQKVAGSPDVIYHLAGGSSVGVAIAKPREDFFRTVSSTIELLEWMRLNAPATRLVAISSAAVYGAGHEVAISESDAQVPYSPYGFHKKMMEQLCHSYATTYGTKVVLARLFSVYGSLLQKQLLWDLCAKLSSGISAVTLEGTGRELRDWTDVRDVVRALCLIRELASDEAPIINVGTGKATSVHDVALMVLDAWPTKATIAFSGHSRSGDPFSLVANSARLQTIGFEWAIPVEIGIRNYVKWYLSSNRIGV